MNWCGKGPMAILTFDSRLGSSGSVVDQSCMVDQAVVSEHLCPQKYILIRSPLSTKIHSDQMSEI